MQYPISILMPSSVTPSYVGYNGESFFVVDGLGAYVYVFDKSGLYLDRFPTFRTYKTAAFCPENNCFCCLARGCGSNVYITNSRFEEISAINLEYQTFADRRETADACFSPDGKCFNVAHAYSLVNYNLDGSYISTVSRPADGKQFLRYRVCPDGLWISYRKKSQTFVASPAQTALLPLDTAIRSFLGDTEKMIAITEKYIYTKIVRAI